MVSESMERLEFRSSIHEFEAQEVSALRRGTATKFDGKSRAEGRYQNSNRCQSSNPEDFKRLTEPLKFGVVLVEFSHVQNGD